MMMNPLPGINKVFSLVIQQEREMDSLASGIVPSAGSTEEISTLHAQANEGHYTAKQGTNSFRPRNQGFNASKGNNRVYTHVVKIITQLTHALLSMDILPSIRTKPILRGIHPLNLHIPLPIMHPTLLLRVHLHLHLVLLRSSMTTSQPCFDNPSLTLLLTLSLLHLLS